MKTTLQKQIIFAALFIVCNAFGVLGQAPLNGDFEADVPGDYTSSGITGFAFINNTGTSNPVTYEILANAGPNNSQALKCTMVGTGGFPVGQVGPFNGNTPGAQFAMLAGEPVIISVWAKAESLGGSDVVQMRYRRGGTVVESLIVPITTTWAQYQFGYTADVDGNYSIQAAIGSISTNAVVYIDNITIASGTLSIDKHLERSKISIYPNPVQERLFIKNDINSDSTWKIRDMLGKSIIEGVGNEVNVNNLIQGIYLIEVNKHNYRFIKN